MTVPMLQTARLRLRGHQPADTATLISAYADESFARFITTQRRALTTEEAWRAVAVVAGSWAASGCGQWIVEMRENGTVVGRVGPWNPPGWPAFEIGWAILPGHQGNGFATEAAASAMVWAHEALGREEFIHLIDPANTPSEGVARRLGATITGQHRFSEEGVANIWTSRWETFTASEPYRRHLGAA